jgi:hypothetical protein
MGDLRKKIVRLFESAGSNGKLDSKRQRVVDDFLEFCQEKLSIAEMPELSLVPRKEEGMSSASYNPATNEVMVLAAHRALVDIIRSIAHELVHRQQDEQGRLSDVAGPGKDMRQDIGVDYENEANAVGGALVKEFSRFYTGLEKDKLYEL